MRYLYQRGELSLLKAAVFMGLVAFAAMLALLSARYEHNFFAEAWRRVMGSDTGKVLQQVQQHTQADSSTTREIHKCMVDGRVLYSNVACSDGPDTSKVKLVDTRGIEPPKVPPVVNPEGPETLQDKVMEKMMHQ